MSFHRLLQAWGVPEVLQHYPGLAIVPAGDAALTLAGTLAFTASAPGLETISDSYDIEISVRSEFPQRVPRVKDLGSRVARDYHRLDDGSFCLGSPARLRLVLAQTPTVPAFIEKCVIPYLYGYSFFERHGQPPFGELAHGDRGIVDDYMQLFRVASLQACIGMLSAIGMKRRVANKLPCPCGSGKRLGRCHHVVANQLRPQLGRAWCRAEAAWLKDEYGDLLRAADARAKLRLAERQAKRKAKAPHDSTVDAKATTPAQDRPAA